MSARTKRCVGRTVKQMVKDGDLFEGVRLRQTFKLNKSGKYTVARNDFVDQYNRLIDHICMTVNP